ncbi:MAG: TIGR03668 family PPOX class F420-dependent oxidoreductase [Candidatus Methylomirabilales bacterium]
MTAKLQESRVGRLATVDEKARPHSIPICYVFDGDVFYTAIDAKPKRVQDQRLARVRNIQANPQVALLIDEYDEDWSQLWYILVRGIATVLGTNEENQKAMGLLKEKYPNYRTGLLPKDALVIRIRPQRITWWGNL